MKELQARLLNEPYRLFFPLGILIGGIGVGHWLFFWLGWSESYSGLAHASIQMQGYMACFVFGFLLTMLQRMLSLPVLNRFQLWLFMVLILINSTALFLQKWLIADLAFLGVILNFFTFIARMVLLRQKKQKSGELKPHQQLLPPAEFVWILISMLCAFIGTAFAAASHLGWVGKIFFYLGRLLREQGFVLCIVAGVGGFLIPRLTGRVEVSKAPVHPADQNKIWRSKVFGYIVTAVILVLSFVLEVKNHVQTAYLIRAAIALGLFSFTHTWPHLPKEKGTLGWVLWLSAGFIVIGYWCVAFAPLYRKALLHIVYLGGYSLMIFSVATMVIFSHGGAVQELKKSLWFLQVVAGLAMSAITCRVAAVLYSEHYFDWLAAGSAAWILAALIWLSFMMPKLGRFPDSKIFEEEHRKAKEKFQGGC